MRGQPLFFLGALQVLTAFSGGRQGIREPAPNNYSWKLSYPADATLPESVFEKEAGSFETSILLAHHEHVVPANSRCTIPANLDAGSNLQLSCQVRVTNGAQIVVERPMYFNYNGVWTGSHDVIGYSPWRWQWGNQGVV